MKTITGSDYLGMVRQGAARLDRSRGVINDLNVFPIPDGDTGDNMYMTISSGCSSASGSSVHNVASSVSRGMLLGARGNSGVILSRIFAGMAKGLDGVEEAGLGDFIRAMEAGVKEAYGAVSRPVEGTILTVLRESVEKARGEDYESYLKSLTAEMHLSLDRTPDLLPVLKEACVVDSGGAGMLCIAEGMLDYLNGERRIDVELAAHEDAKCLDLDNFGPDTELQFGYCTEFLLRLQTSKVGNPMEFDESSIRDYLCSVGESVVCFRDGSIVKAHVHTFDPGSILTHARQWGEFLTIKIENMTLQHSEVQIKDKFSAKEESFVPEKQFGVVAVAAGEGLCAAFRDAGADIVIEGGQTMNPSAQSFMEAFDTVKARTVFVFPNNSNIIMTAGQAAQMYGRSKVIVIPSKDIGAGYVGVASMDLSSKDPEAIAAAACETVATVSTGMVSRATRDACINGINMREGDYIGIAGGKILVASPDRFEASRTLAGKLDIDAHEVALVFSGEEVDTAEEERFFNTLQNEFPRTEIMGSRGGQPVYDYIIVLC